MFRWLAISCFALVLTACRDEVPAVPVSITQQVMREATIPASEAIFSAAGNPPGDGPGWRNVQANAAALADSGQRLIRAVRGGEKEKWVKLAGALVLAAKQVDRAAGARDADALAAAGERLYASCENCHSAFLRRRGEPK